MGEQHALFARLHGTRKEHDERRSDESFEETKRSREAQRQRETSGLVTSPWVKRAEEKQLPAKELKR